MSLLGEKDMIRKVYVLAFPSKATIYDPALRGCFYPIGPANGYTSVYETYEQAKDKLKLLTKHDGVYIKGNGGLNIIEITTEEAYLGALKLFLHKEKVKDKAAQGLEMKRKAGVNKQNSKKRR
jgi:hypothetical protein